MASASVESCPWPRWLPDSIQYNRRVVDLDDASKNIRRNGRISKLDALDAVSIPLQRLFGRHGSGSFGHYSRVIFTS